MPEAADKPPSTTRLALMLVVWIGVFLATLSVLLRGYIRRRYNGGFQLDDIFTFFALALLIASAIMYTVIREPMFNLVEVLAGIQPSPTTPEAAAKFVSETELYMRMQFAITVAFWSCLWTVKASFLTLFYPLGNGLKLDRMLWYGATAITVIGYIFCVISYPISCTAFTVGSCSTDRNIQLSLLSLKGSTALDIISDLAIIILPWKLLWVVKRSRTEKIAIGSIVGLGLIIIVFAVVRVIVTNTTRTHPELVWLALWSAIESTIAVIVVSLTSLRVYIVKGARSGTGSRSTKNGGGYSARGPGFDIIAGAGPNGGAIQLKEFEEARWESTNTVLRRKEKKVARNEHCLGAEHFIDTDAMNSSHLTGKTLELNEGKNKFGLLKRKNESISLLPVEQLFRKLLLDCRDDLRRSESTSPTISNLEIWVTGGWVRDKLLGIQSSDIDIALSTMTGAQFVNVLTDFYSRNEAEYSQQASEMGVPSRLLFSGFKTTTRNPDMSKDLETAVGKVFGLDVDLVNLRTEVYIANSRTPKMEFGTAREDAFRRDATINALFYNLDKQQLKDFTGMGLDDMAANIIRTPLEPYQTFIDDPLRVLRTIRFASSLGYSIVPGSRQLMKDKMIHRALSEKVKRDRIGLEIVKMMKDRNPSLAFGLIHEAGLYSTVFLGRFDTAELRQALALPDHNADDSWPTNWPSALRVLATLLDNTTTVGKTLGKMLVQGEEKSADLWTIAAYAPIAGLRHTKGKLEKTVKDVMGSIKATNGMSKLIEDSITHMDDIQSTINLTTASSSSVIPRSVIGMAIRSWGTTWKLQVLYSLLAEVVYEQSAPAVHLERYSTFMTLVFQQNLQDAPAIKPILDGNGIKEVFGLKSTGPFMKAALDGLLRWQFDHEGGSQDDAKDWLRTRGEYFGIP
ncbi:hypothetical protein V494_00181 [Pseudogymnoascus sp. VKM F-4513 (FW-928)]|nr:hypothetical protein V494_00181 [Pseudogymnoascus sp. VKM F-4513 (FW-928)]